MAVESVAAQGIVTPDAVVLDVETAGVAARVLAGLIDLAIQLGALWLMLLVFAGFVIQSDSSSGVETLFAITFFAMVILYPVVSETLMRGRTIGKRAMGLRVVTVEGSPIRLRHAMLRMMGGLVDRFLPPTGITGMLFVLGRKRHQRVGDLLAGTIVIRDPQRTALPTAMWYPVPRGLEQFAASLDPTALTDQQYTVIRSFLLRNHLLSGDARFTVSRDLAERTAATIGHTLTGRVAPEPFLLCAIARYQRRTFPQYTPPAWQGRP